jgi:hypothetical protein
MNTIDACSQYRYPQTGFKRKKTPTYLWITTHLGIIHNFLLGGLARKYIETLEVVHLAIIVRDEAFLAKGLFDHS